jgi:hypothetical protein
MRPRQPRAAADAGEVCSAGSRPYQGPCAEGLCHIEDNALVAPKAGPIEYRVANVRSHRPRLGLAGEPATEPTAKRSAAGFAMNGRTAAVARLEAVTHRYGKVVALDGVSLDVTRPPCRARWTRRSGQIDPARDRSGTLADAVRTIVIASFLRAVIANGAKQSRAVTVPPIEIASCLRLLKRNTGKGRRPPNSRV